jgi:16S rRNA (cytosine967-C5)-methyltransferase
LALRHAVQLLSAVLRFEQPADALLSQHLRENRELDRAARAFVAEAVFGVLRAKRLLDHFTQNGNPRLLLLAWLAHVDGRNLRELEPLLKRDEKQTLAAIKAMCTDDLPLAVRAELPDWVAERLAVTHSEADILALGRALATPAPLDLRVNTLRAKRDDVLKQLQGEGLAVHATPYAPHGLRIAGRPAINRHALFLDGTLEVQDEGSQLLCQLVAPDRHGLTVDFCAGAGGKTLALGAMMQGKGRLYAFDTSATRLKRLQPRLARSGLSNVHPIAISNENDLRVKRLAGKAARVLVDAPCSGLGTLRRNPDLKWRQSPQSVAELMVKQAAILRAAATLVEPGGRLIYGTCSLLAEENEAIVKTFLAMHPNFSVLDCDDVLAKQHIALRTGRHLRLTPHVHGTDGFFGAVLAREA